MRVNFRFLAMIAASSLVTLYSIVSAHHSVSVFDQNTVTEIEGEIVRV
jgi:hypothetical protein